MIKPIVPYWKKLAFRIRKRLKGSLLAQMKRSLGATEIETGNKNEQGNESFSSQVRTSSW
ncbi:hypothetical protein F2Q70_00012391 [Brassica cretica]|uniref:Uncharacterized protein n=1 Tax=Brassica cretica TaxID=69181 RepID=A0A3N6QPM9_BRACR|nr:hypothetical protein F2Q70_00012391 [Brassica cretica]KAF3544058.1 hypothetical protein DY000_02008360 [Brassica cretica]